MSAGRVIVRVGSSLRDALYFMCDGPTPDEPRLTPVQSAAMRFEDAEGAREKIRALAGHAWAVRMRPVRLCGVRAVARLRSEAAPVPTRP